MNVSEYIIFMFSVIVFISLLHLHKIIPFKIACNVRMKWGEIVLMLCGVTTTLYPENTVSLGLNVKTNITVNEQKFLKLNRTKKSVDNYFQQ